MKKEKSTSVFSTSKTVLYALYACSENENSRVSKIAIQKLLYLSVIFAPIKNIILDFIKYQFQTNGPYSKEVQNAIDSLVSKGQVIIVNYAKSKRGTHIDYEISEGGKSLVRELIETEEEMENFWWISSICKLAIIYSKEDYQTKKTGLDKIVDFVYQEPTFLKSKIGKKSEEDYKKGYRKLPIRFNLKKGTSNELISFSKQYLKRNNIKIDKTNEKWIAELLLFNFFEFLYNKILLTAK